MPKILQNETCRAETKKTNAGVQSTTKSGKSSAAAKTPSASPKRKTPKSVANNAVVSVDNDKKSKNVKKTVDSCRTVAKTKKITGMKDKIAIKTTNAADATKSSNKQIAVTAKCKDGTVSKKQLSGAALNAFVKKKARAESGEADGVKQSANVAPAIIPSTTVNAKETKKRKEPTDKLKKKIESGEIAAKKTSAKVEEPKPKDLTKWLQDSKKIDESRMAPKKRIKHKCAKESFASSEQDGLSAVEAKKEEIPKPKVNDLTKNVKFFKSKARRMDKTKDQASTNTISKDLKEALAVYDNIDEDSEGCSAKMLKKQPKIKSSPLRPSPKKTKPSKIGKRKLESDSDVERVVKNKKARKNAIKDEDDEDDRKESKITAKSSGKCCKSKIDEDSSSMSTCSDNAPLNRLVPSKKLKHDGECSPPSDKSAKSKTVSSKTSPKTDKSKKSVRFSKQTVDKVTKPAVTRRRRQRMASLNARVMVHCMYENENKNIASSFESAENSDTNVDLTTTSRIKSEGKEIELTVPSTPIKLESNPEPDPVISRESLRSAPGLRSVGKHWDMNSSSASSQLSDVENAAKLQTATTNSIVSPAPVVIEEIPCADDKRQVKNAVIKKKFARALCRHVSEDSSEEDRHQALLLKEKQRMMRRRRKQRKEMTMDLKDMVVCKRMASLNATAILAASYSSATATGKRTITVKSASAASTASSTAAAKSEEKCDNSEEPSMSKIKGRKLPQFMRKKFHSSSDADVEDEADLSSNEMVHVKTTASSSGKQQVSLIVNQDSGVTITGLYMNSTTKSTHHQGYCSISGMQYRISSSHAQTEATTVTTEPIVRNPQEPARPSISLLPDRQLSPPSRNMPHASPAKSYTPLGALSNMQPPGSPHHIHHLRHHPKTMTIASTQEISSLERHGCPSAFSAPAVYVPPPPTVVSSRPPYPIISKTPPEAGYVAGYYQPAGPLISHHHHHHHHHHHVQNNSSSTATSTPAASMPPTAAPPVTTTVPATVSSSLTFAKVSQSPLAQPPTPPASNITQPISETSDNDMASATTPAAEISVSENAAEEINYPVNYRLGSAATVNAPFRSPSSHNSYQTYYPSPPSTASLSHPQPQPAHFQEVLYTSNPPSSGSGPYHHLGFLQPKPGLPYHHHTALPRRYIPALPPQQQHQYFHHEYSPAAALSSQQSVMMPAHPLASTSDSYHSAPPTPSIIETYPPPPPPPPPLYYTGYNSAPPTPYYPYATASRSLTLVETTCPCPLQGCQKNVDTGPLTGFISKGPVVEQRNTPLSPVALSLPREPHDIRSLPSPARGSAGSRPIASPAIATAKNPSSSWAETSSDYGYDTAGLLTISSGSSNSSVVSSERVSMASVPSTPTAMVATLGDSTVELDSGVSEDAIVIETAGKNLRNRADRREKTARTRKTKSSRLQQRVGTGAAAPPSSQPSEMDKYPRYLEPMTATTNESSGQRNRCRCHLRRQLREGDGDNDDTHDTNSSDLELPPKLYPEVGPDFEKRRSQKEENETDEISSPPPVKRFRRESLRDDDVQKNNYLSALQLKSVNGNCDESNESTTIQALQVTASTFANAVRESAVAFGRHSTMKIAANSKGRDSGQDVVKGLHSEQLADTESTSNSLSSIADTECCQSTNVSAAFVGPKKGRFRCRRRWTTKKKKPGRKNAKPAKGGSEEEKEAENAEKRLRDELLSLSLKRASCRLKWSNGWMWLGEPFVAKVFLNTEGPEVLRSCYHGMKHEGGDTIRPKDCILLRSGSKKTDLPYVAKVAHLWEDPDDGEMMMSLFWYYRPEHTEHDNVISESPSELYASKHKDVNSVACIEDKCYVLTFNEYCRYHKSIRQNAESVDISSIIVPPLAKKRYPRQAFLPPENTSQDLVFFCRKIYDFRQHRLLKNPFFV